MALHRGIQSAIFYYLSCAPCTEARTRRKRRQEADLLRKEKEALDARDQAEGLNQYAHPLPSTTNPAWGLEIAIGPSKESKAAARQSKSRAKETPPRSSGSTSKSEGKDSKSRSTPDLSLDDRVRWADSFQRNCRIKPPTKANTFPQDRPHSNLSPLDESREELDYDRPSPKSSHENASPTASSSASASINPQRPAPTKLATTSLSSPAWPYQHPPINDLHPATVTKYDSALDVSWMLAPPPSAKVMRGHKPERPHHLSPRKPTPALDIRSSRTMERQASTGAEGIRSAEISPGDTRGLGIGYESEETEEVGSVVAGDDRAMEKRDSAGPQPGRDPGGKYLFPPREWGLGFGEDRRDSGSEAGWPDHIGVIGEKGMETIGVERKWRWSIS
ncbi:Hypothetical protein D9617_41g062430 [Elsinoe fawcettii]|nr:Hypothetical protein D9617_41g062430 [Elsinoe fawcettii]